MFHIETHRDTPFEGSHYLLYFVGPRSDRVEFQIVPRKGLVVWTVFAGGVGQDVGSLAWEDGHFKLVGNEYERRFRSAVVSGRELSVEKIEADLRELMKVPAGE